MSLTDCARCWDTPCVCGNEGYLTIWLPPDHGLSRDKIDELREHLKDTMTCWISWIEEHKED